MNYFVNPAKYFLTLLFRTVIIKKSYYSLNYILIMLHFMEELLWQNIAYC